MSRTLAVVVALAQMGVLAFMAIQRESVERTGHIIYLRTAPVDPSSPMRGEYLALSYEISQVPRALCRDGVAQWFDAKGLQRSHRDQRVYAALATDANGLAELVSLSDRPPAGSPYLRARVVGVVDNPGYVRLRYGLEAFFVEEGAAKTFEDDRRKNEAGVPLDMEVAVSESGMAVLRGYRYEPLGVRLIADPVARPPAAAGRAGQRTGIAGVTVEIKNHSDKPVAILTWPLRLISNRQRSSNHYRWVGEDGPPRMPAPEDVMVLQPGENFRQHLDLTFPDWFVVDTTAKGSASAPVALGTLLNAWDASFCIEYAPPDAKECADFPHADIIWHGHLPSRAFGPAAGSID